MADLSPENFKSQSLQVQQIALSLAIGTCLMSWANVEQVLHEIFVQRLVRQSRNKNRWVIARSIWSVIISFEARLRMVDAAFNSDIHGRKSRRYERLRTDWRLLYNYASSMSKLRNEIAHGTVMVFDDNKTKETKVAPYATTIPFRGGISIVDVYNRAKLFTELAQTFDRLEASSARWKAGPRRYVLIREPTPDLILRLRKQKAQHDRSRKQKKARRARPHRKSRAHHR